MTDRVEHLPAPSELRYETADEYLEAIRTLASAYPGRPLTLDWQELSRFEAAASVLLANGLLGSLGRTKLVIRIPDDPERLKRFARSGLSFALANRASENTKIVGRNEALLNLSSWRQSWSRSSPMALSSLNGDGREPLFLPGESGAGNRSRLVAADHAAFINPHLTAPVRGQSDVARVVRPWLNRLLRREDDAEESSHELETFVRDISALIDELLENVREHAVFRPDNNGPVESLVQLAVLDSSRRRIYVAVQDTGPGIPETAGDKISLASNNGTALSDQDLVAGLLSGTFFPWNRGQGMGLPRIREICAGRGGRLRIATRCVRVDAADGLVAGTAGFDLLGTVVVGMIPVPDVKRPRAGRS